MSTLIWIFAAVLTACLMEFWARFAHQYAWHGPLYAVHHSHHHPTGPLEANDLFAVVHALPAIVLIVIGCEVEGVLATVGFGIGIGMTLFGAAYAIVHEGVIHERFPTGPLGRIPFLKRVRAAHRAHHKTGEAPYGLFLGPQELRNHSRRIAGARQAARARLTSSNVEVRHG